MAEIVKAYVVKVMDYGLSNPDATLHDTQKRAIVFTEDDAKECVKNLINNSVYFDPLLHNQRVSNDGRGITWTSIDPKKDGYAYYIWYEETEIVFT